MTDTPTMAADEFWPRSERLDIGSEAEVEQRLLLPMLRALGYDDAEITPKAPIIFQEGRKGRPHEADLLVHEGRDLNDDTTLIVVEAKAPGQDLEKAVAQAASYAHASKAPFLLLTDGKVLEIWQLQPSRRSERVLLCAVGELRQRRGDIERLIGRSAAIAHCRSLGYRPLSQAAGDVTAYIESELARMSDPCGVARRVSADGRTVDAMQGLDQVERGAMVLAPSGFGKTTLARDAHRHWLSTLTNAEPLPFLVPLSDLAEFDQAPEDYARERLSARCPQFGSASAFAALIEDRGNILISLTTALDRFNHGWLRDAFCAETTLVPELTFHGAIILLNMPALTLNEDGIIAQQLFKYMWQRAVLARNGLEPSQRDRPVFLWADEAQYFVNSYDAEFLSTCRGSRASVVFLTQSLPTFYAKMGGDNARDRVHHLLGNFATRIWHNNACAETNEWAARTIGRSLQQRSNFSHGHGSSTNYGMNLGDGTNWGSQSSSGGSSSYSYGSSGGGSSSAGSNWSSGSSAGGSDNRGRNRGYGTNSSESRGYSETMDHMIEPGAFSRMLKTGGPAHGNRVSAIWFQAGRRFQASGGNALLAEFRQ